MIKRARPVQPSAPAEEKFSALSKWIPASANAILTADIYKIAQSSLWDNIMQSGAFNFWKYLKAQGIDFKSDIGMFTAFMEISSPSKTRGPVLLIQGGFHQDIIVSRVKEQALQDELDLISEKYKGITIYSEKTDGENLSNSYAFAAIDDGIIAIAGSDNLKWIIDDGPKKSGRTDHFKNIVDWNVPIWGKMIIDEGLSASLPPPWNEIDSLELDADLAEDIAARLTVNLKEGGDVKRLKNALEGFIAIEALQRLDDKKVLNVIDKISIKEAGKSITIEIPQDLKLLNLLILKGAEEDETENEDD